MDMLDAVHEIYTVSFPALPIGKERLGAVLRPDNSEQKIVLAHVDGVLAGGIVYNRYGVLLLAVKPAYRRRGIGGRLLALAEDYVRSSGSSQVKLGHAGHYLWPGVPVVPDTDVDFFAHRGYQSGWTSIDMALDLTVPPLPFHSTVDIALTIKVPDTLDPVLACVAKIDGSWLPYYRDAPRERMLSASHNGEVVGCVMLVEDDIRLADCFPGRVGGLGCLGVAPEYREHGIGLALANAATEQLRREGYAVSYLGYTWLEDWYGRLGYRTYLRYWMGEIAQNDSVRKK